MFTPSTNGTYYVHLVQHPENARLLESSSYELTVTEAGTNDEMANTTSVEYEQDVVATLSAGEEDWYAVDGYAGRKLLADIRYLEPVPGGSLQVDVLTANGDVVTEVSTDDGDASNVVSTDPNTYTLAHAADVMEANETYYIGVSESPTAETNGSMVYKYTFNAEANEFDTGDSSENEPEPTSTPVTATETTHLVVQEV